MCREIQTTIHMLKGAGGKTLRQGLDIVDHEDADRGTVMKRGIDALSVTSLLLC